MRYTTRFYRLLTAFSVALGLASLALGITAPVVNGRAIVSVFGVLLAVRLLAAGVMGIQRLKSNPAGCRISVEWTGHYIGRRYCSTHDVRWDSDEPCPGRVVEN